MTWSWIWTWTWSLGGGEDDVQADGDDAPADAAGADHYQSANISEAFMSDMRRVVGVLSMGALVTLIMALQLRHHLANAAAEAMCQLAVCVAVATLPLLSMKRSFARLFYPAATSVLFCARECVGLVGAIGASATYPGCGGEMTDRKGVAAHVSPHLYEHPPHHTHTHTHAHNATHAHMADDWIDRYSYLSTPRTFCASVLSDVLTGGVAETTPAAARNRASPQLRPRSRLCRLQHGVTLTHALQTRNAQIYSSKRCTRNISSLATFVCTASWARTASVHSKTTSC